jgi:hypothetical protein
VPGVNSPDDLSCFWSLIGSKTFKTSYFSCSGIITRLDQVRGTCAPIDKSKEKIVHQKYLEKKVK